MWGCFDVSNVKVNAQLCAPANFRKIVSFLGTLDSIQFETIRNDSIGFIMFRRTEVRPLRLFHLPRSSLVRPFRSRRCERGRDKRVSRSIVSATIRSARVPLAGPRFDLSVIFGLSQFFMILRSFENSRASIALDIRKS